VFLHVLFHLQLSASRSPLLLAAPLLLVCLTSAFYLPSQVDHRFPLSSQDSPSAASTLMCRPPKPLADTLPLVGCRLMLLAALASQARQPCCVLCKSPIFRMFSTLFALVLMLSSSSLLL